MMKTTIICRPLSGLWPSDGREYYQPCRFKAPYLKTLDDLDRELQSIAVTRAVIEMDLQERDIRIDGWPRANATPDSPRVRLCFDHPEVGPLQYPCDIYESWRDNLRGIVKTLEAQRAMDRYGATRLNQQYSGWKALPGEVAPTFNTPMAAAQWLSDVCGLNDDLIMDSREALKNAKRMAAKKLHPDTGGSNAQFTLLGVAVKMIERYQLECAG